jgi:transcriptional regulator
VDLLAGTLDLIVLRLLQAGPASGWDLTQRIRLLSRDAFDVKEGSLYPALYRLEAKELIRGQWGRSSNNRRAKYYSLTRAGLKQLTAERTSWERFAGALALILEAN